jgi:tetratricopeptide (TPR) repeat protein
MPAPEGGRVIHVAFGRGGGRVEPPPPPPAPTDESVDATPHSEPQLALFTSREVERLLGADRSKLRSLHRAGIVSPTGLRGGKPAYTFSDLIALRATFDLLAKDVKLREVAKAISALRKTLPRVTRPLQELRITSDGRKIVVRAEGATFEPTTGQMMLDFHVEKLERDVVRVLRPESREARAQAAYDLYLRASALDEDAARFDEAAELYERAVTLDPYLAIGYTNLGNIRFRQGREEEAESLYRRALSLDERQPEAHYNLGYVMLERGKFAQAVDYFQRALATDPKFADAHFNLAMAYASLEDRSRARRHWRKYLELEPEGAWAEIARAHLPPS